MNQPTAKPAFDPMTVGINYTLNFHQVNLILKGWAKLPREETEGIYDQVRAIALQTLQAAEAEHNQAAQVDSIAEALGVETPAE